MLRRLEMQEKDELGENHWYDMVQNFYDETTKDVMSVHL